MPGTRCAYRVAVPPYRLSPFTRKYLVVPIVAALDGCEGPIIDIGCGTGELSRALHAQIGSTVVGVDRSSRQLTTADEAGGGVSFHLHEIEDELPLELHGLFDVAVSTEVIEHLYRPGMLFRRATESGATRMLLSTPYHGYLKNIAIALTNKFDHHWESFRDGGHIKFFSVATLGVVAEREGWTIRAVQRVGRVGPLAKSMIVDLERVP